jgi:hypothetical protein
LNAREMPGPYARGVRLRPLGWELTTATLVMAAISVAFLLSLSQNTVADSVAGLLGKGVIAALLVATPIVLLSACVRLVAGILDEDRRYRFAKVLSGRSAP